MYGELVLLLAAAVVAGHAKSCDVCVRGAIARWPAGARSDLRVEAHLCERTYKAVGDEMCFFRNSCRNKNVHNMDKPARAFCAKARQSVACAARGGRNSRNCRKRINIKDFA